jgi:hypothetical protein
MVNPVRVPSPLDLAARPYPMVAASTTAVHRSARIAPRIRSMSAFLMDAVGLWRPA